MKRIIPAILFLLSCATLARGQSTTVSGQITDGGGQSWNNGTCQFQFQANPQFPTGPYTWTGGTLNQVIACTMGGTGAYSQSVPSNTAISPQGSTWILQVTPNATSPSFSTPPTTITGATQTLNVTPLAILIRWTDPPGPTNNAYADAEISTANLPKGAEYFNVTSNLTRVWSGSAWSAQGSGGPATPCGANTQIQYNNLGACGASAFFTFDQSSGSFNASGATANSSIVSGPTSSNSFQVIASNTIINALETNANITESANKNIQFTVGSANPFNLPTATGAANTLLFTNGANPQVTAWSTNLTWAPSTLSLVAAGGVNSQHNFTAGTGGANLFRVAGSGSGANGIFALALDTGATGAFESNGTLKLASITGNVQLGDVGQANPVTFLGQTSGATTVQSPAVAGEELDIGLVGGGNAVLGLKGNTSGIVTCTAPAVAGTTSNPLACSNAIQAPSFNTILSGGIGGTIIMPEGAAPSAIASDEVLYADSTSHVLKGANNGGSFLPYTQATGALTSGHCVQFSGAVNLLVDSGSTNCGGAGGVALSAITAAVGSNTIANGNNPQTWNWAQTTNTQAGMTFGETSAATGGTLTSGIANQSNVTISTASGSTATPFSVVQGANTSATAFPAAQIQFNWNNAGLVGEGLLIRGTNTASSGLPLILDVGINSSLFSVDKNATVNSTGLFQAPTFRGAAAATAVTYQSGVDTANIGTTGAATFKGGDNSSVNAAAVAGAATVRGGDETAATLATTAGALTVRAGDSSSSNTGTTAGALTIRPGRASAVASATDKNGKLAVLQTFFTTGTATVGSLACVTADLTVATCATAAGGNANIGIIVAVNSNTVDVQTAGVVNALAVSAAFTAGHFACADLVTTAGDVVDSSTACAAGSGVGIVLHTATTTTPEIVMRSF